jgi:hypothetical protein
MDLSRRQGVLNPQNQEQMYWDQKDGYIFFKMEGTSPVAPANLQHRFRYHIGGYGGFVSPGINNIREITLHMGSAVAQIRPEKAPKVHLHADILEFFANPSPVSIQLHPEVMLSDYSTTLSRNYQNMFRYDHVHN